MVGVFMDQSVEEVAERAAAAGVDAVQLHGGEDVAFVKELQKRLPDTWLIKARLKLRLEPLSSFFNMPPGNVSYVGNMSCFFDGSYVKDLLINPICLSLCLFQPFSPRFTTSVPDR